MLLVIECIILCIIMWIICFLSTGTDEKNMFGLRSYPIEVQETIRNSEKYRNKVKPTNMIKVFITNLIMFYYRNTFVKLNGLFCTGNRKGEMDYGFLGYDFRCIRPF